MPSPNFTADPNETDEGGVHTNSGVNNKTDYLITDGDTFNGQTVTGHRDRQGGAPLLHGRHLDADLGERLRRPRQRAAPGVREPAAGGVDGITTADCTQVGEAVAATEMDQNPAERADQHGADVRRGPGRRPDVLRRPREPGERQLDDAGISGPNGWFYPQNPNPLRLRRDVRDERHDELLGLRRPGHRRLAIEMANPSRSPTAASCASTTRTASTTTRSTRYDGGVVEYSTNGGATWSDAGPLFDSGGYNGTISTLDTNPLGGRAAFVAESNGMGSSRANLGPLAGQSVRFRFRIGTDSSSTTSAGSSTTSRSTAARARCRTRGIDKVKTKKAKSG